MGKKKHKILFISDTHGKHKTLEKRFALPKADTIVHAGDVSNVGRDWQIKEFLNWFGGLDQYKNKIMIAGNHDFLFENNPTLAKEMIPDNIHYLEDSGVEIDGINFWGSPVTPPFFDWAFMRSEDKIKKHWEYVPENTDVLITHGPPYTILDTVYRDYIQVGSKSLLAEVMNRIKPQIHVFGHIHETYGVEEHDGIKYINASNLNLSYDVVNKPILIELDIKQ